MNYQLVCVMDRSISSMSSALPFFHMMLIKSANWCFFRPNSYYSASHLACTAAYFSSSTFRYLSCCTLGCICPCCELLFDKIEFSDFICCCNRATSPFRAWFYIFTLFNTELLWRFNLEILPLRASSLRLLRARS